MVTSTPFSSSSQVYEWAYSFINVERGQNLRSFCLDRTIALAEMSGNPEKCAPSFHIAGSKGKGSVTGMISSILETAGKKTALYSSPHIIDFRERITAGHEFFDEKIYVSAANELKKTVEAIPFSPHAALFDPKTDNGQEPSFFELMTLWFFLCARLAGSEVMTVETGMGGRLDSTNIVDPLVSIITRIELEHTDFLGKTITAIAGEKAGIIKASRPLILAEQTGEALKVFREHVEAKNCPLYYFPDCAEISNVRLSREGTYFSLHIGFDNFNEFFVPVPGEVQAENAGLAILAIRTAYPEISAETIREGLSKFTLPARFERISDKPVVIVDGAHTPRSIEKSLKTFAALYGQGAILLFGCAEGKDVDTMAKLCLPCFSRIIITTPGTFKKSYPEETYKVFQQEAEDLKTVPEILFIPDTVKAIDQALSLAAKYDLPVLAAGSFYLAAEVRKMIKI